MPSRSSSSREPRFRVELFQRELFARLRGSCNRAPLYMVDGGYHFWRCGLKRGHAGPCRTGNYWWGPGDSIYDPITPYTRSLDGSAGVETRRQRESRRRWNDLSDLKRAIEDREAQRAVEAAEAITGSPFKATDQGDY